MSVSVGMHHELNAALNALLMTLTNLIEDGLDDLINTVLTDGNDRFDYLLLSSRIFRIDYIDLRSTCISIIIGTMTFEDRLFSIAHHNCIYYSF